MSTRAPLSKPRRLAALLLLAVLPAGCGAQQPQPPAVQANRVTSALTGITEACAEHSQEAALPAFRADGAGPRQAARMRAAELARIVSENPRWIYQGHTLGEVLAATVSYLSECHLGSVAAALKRQTRP
jgi:hypothetical protein